MNRRYIIAFALTVAVPLTLAVLSSALRPASCFGQAQGLTTTPIPTDVPEPTTTSPPVTHGDILAVYREVLESTLRTAEDTRSTTDAVLKLVSIVFVGLGLAGLGGAWWLNKSVDKAEKALKQASDATDLVNRLAEKGRELEQSQQEFAQSLARAQRDLSTFSSDLIEWKKLAEKDRNDLKRSLELIQIDEHAMSIFSDDSQRRWSSIRSLIEMSHRPDPIVRRRCVRVFGALETYDEGAFRRLEEMASTDPARGVKREAEEALCKLQLLVTQEAESGRTQSNSELGLRQ